MLMNLILLKDTYSIYKFRDEHNLPYWIYSSEFYSITRTSEEFSVVAPQVDLISSGIISNRDWRILKIAGTLDFCLTGIIARITAILAKEAIPVFIVSSYDTDYILVKQDDLDNSIRSLSENGYFISVNNE